jgi:hypothetical protein
MIRVHVYCLTAVALACSAGTVAADYPVSGKWTYEQSPDPGPAPATDCTRRTMEFRGMQRLDTGGSVPQYRNVYVLPSNAVSSSLFAVVDEFFNVQIRGRIEYRLRIIDKDHIELHMQRGGALIPLRRCA